MNSNGTRDASPVSDFFVDVVTLDSIEISADTISIHYTFENYCNTVEIEYEPEMFRRACFCESETFEPVGRNEKVDSKVFQFAVALGVLGISKFAPVLPRKVDLSRYSEYIHPSWLAFVKASIPRKWSEHRFQVDAFEYQHPEFDLGVHDVGTNANAAIWSLTEHTTDRNWGIEDPKVMIASGSGKDSLLCSLMLQEAGVEHDLVTYFFDLYGSLEDQKEIFRRVSDAIPCGKRHGIILRDNFYSWLEDRMERCCVRKRLGDAGIAKPFRTEAGEVFFGSVALLPIQVAYGIQYQLFGNEKSADAPNLTIKNKQETVAHQWAKSIEGERAIQRIFDELFPGYKRTSLTKPIHDVKIFETLFRLGGELPYQTNSCNIEKPWCCKCEKCAYVFLGFCAFGDYQKVVAAFGQDMLADTDLTGIWEELLGLKGNIPWECVGQPKEVQLYLWMIRNKGLRNAGVANFDKKFVKALRAEGIDLDEYFDQIYTEYSQVFEHHHYMPHWLFEKVNLVLTGLESEIELGIAA